MKHPLLRVAAWYVAGVWLGAYWPLPVGWLLGWAWGMCGVYWACPGLRRWGLGPLLVVVGMARYGLETAVMSPYDLRRLEGWGGAAVTVRGELAMPPEQRVGMRRGEEISWTWAVIEVEGLRREGGEWQRGVGRIAVRTQGFLGDGFGVGQRVDVDGVLWEPEGALVAGMFDTREHLRRQGIYHQLRVSSPGHWRCGAGEASRERRLSERFAAWAKGTLGRGHVEEDVYVRLIWAMALGWKTGLSGEVAEPFMESGTMHIFAISGLHVAMITLCLAGVLRVAGVTRAWSGLVTMPLIWFYTAATGWQASAVRSTVMSSVMLTGWIVNRPGDLMNSLGAAALILLVWDPKQLFQPGFQLSFFVVLSMVLAGPSLEGMRQRVLASSEWVEEGWRGWCRRQWRKGMVALSRSVATSLAAWAGSLPLVACYFHYFNPVAILANVVVVPLSGLVLASCMGSLIVGPWWGWGCEVFNQGAWFWMLAMVKCSEWAAAMPYGWGYVPSPPGWAMAMYYGLLAGVACGGWRHVAGRWGIGIGVVALAGLMVGGWVRERSQHELLVVPVEGGESTLFWSAGWGAPMLIDGGNEEIALHRTVPVMKARGVNRLSGMVLTHGDVRHVGGALRIAKAFQARDVYGSDISFRSGPYRDVKHRFAGMGLWRPVSDGDTIGAWRVLHPPLGGRYSKADDGPVVLWGEWEGCRVLLMSDLSASGQNELLNRHPDLRADVVVTGVPAQSEPVLAGFLEVVRPRCVIVVDAPYPAYARASPGLKRRLAEGRLSVWYTGTEGAVRLVMGKGGWRVESGSGGGGRVGLEHLATSASE